MSEKQLLKDPDIYPDDNVLGAVMGDRFAAYTAFMGKLPVLNIQTEWRYYNDGKAWLCKNTFKKKTVFWLSVWEGYFTVSLFFTEKTIGGVLDLPVAAGFKQFQKATGKLIPLIVRVQKDTNLEDLLMVIEYKRNLK